MGERRRPIGRSIICGIVAFATLAGCGGTDPDGAPPSVSEQSTLVVAEMTIPPTDTALAGVPSTTTATTTPTVALSSLPAASTSSTSTTVPPEEPTAQLVVGWASGTITVHDSQTGALTEILTTFDPYSPLFTSLVGRTADGTTVFGTSVEDSWYSCDTVLGTIEVVSPDGTSTGVPRAGSPTLSGDGSSLAYVSFSECGQDPAESTPSMLPLVDTIVVRSVATGEEQRWKFPAGGDHTVVESVIWYGTSLVAIVDGRLLELDPDDPTVPDVDSGMLVQDITGGRGSLTLLGARADGTVIAHLPSAMEGGDPIRLVAFDPTSRGELTELATVEPSSISVDRTATHWAAIVDGAVLVDGRELLLEVPPRPAHVDPGFADSPDSVSW